MCVAGDRRCVVVYAASCGNIWWQGCGDADDRPLEDEWKSTRMKGCTVVSSRWESARAEIACCVDETLSNVFIVVNGYIV